jgi:hypothetical protein
MIEKTRRRVFFSACIPFRISLALLAIIVVHSSILWLKIASSIILFLIAAGFLSKFIENPSSGFLKGKVWWHYYRLLHIVTFGTSGVLLLIPQVDQYAPIVLAIDALAGLVFGIHQYYIKKE